jgi:HK97 family phage major capsid protein
VSQKVAELKRKRSAAYEIVRALADKETLTDAEQSNFTAKTDEVRAFDSQIKRALEAQALAASTARPVAGQVGMLHVEAGPDPYTDDDFSRKRGYGPSRSLVVGGMVRMCAKVGGNAWLARQVAQEMYGEAHPVTRALVASVGSSGGFIVPPDYMNEIVEILRPKAVVRAAGPREIPMPRGTMTLPSQTAPATASYGTESSKIASSQQSTGQIVASFKKLTGLVPVSNDLLRYAEPAADAFVRDDLVKVIALAQDLAFITGDGTAASPMGFLGFANRNVANSGGTPGVFSSSANSTAAVGGQFVTSNETYTLATAASELGGLDNKLDTANVSEDKRVWFFHPRTYNYLYNVQNSLGVYVYRAELEKGTLLGKPFKKTTQIPINIHDTTSTNTDCSFIFLVEMADMMLFDSMSLELAVSREGTYVDGGGNTVSAFQSDQTIIRAITEHDFQTRHDVSVAVLQFVRWAPAIS